MGQGYYHCAVKPVGRATGRSAVAAAAYRSAERIDDERTGLTHDYRAKGGVVESFIIAPAGAPKWAGDRAALWNAVEAATTAKNGRLATELELALPHELTAEKRRVLVESFVRNLAERYKVAVDVAIHEPGRGGDHRNHHAHVMITHRELGPDGFGKLSNRRTIERKVKGQIKAVEIGGFTTSEDTSALRKSWAEATNAAYLAAGLDIRVDHRSHAERGLSAEPTKHLGPSASAMERRGEATSRGDINRDIASRNAQLGRIEAERISLAAAIAELVAERQRRADTRELRAAVRTASADRILAAMTEKRATFTRAELVRMFGRGVADRAEAGALATELLAHPDIVGLRETAADPVSRYTTREVLAAERQILKDGRALAEATGSGLAERHRNAALKKHRQLDEEQRAAFDYATGRRGLAIIAGEAGTGKTTTLAAIRDAYEAAGCRVIGLAWTNSVVQDMKGDGFREAPTISTALGRLDRGGDQWNRKTVLIVDEAAMLSSRHLGRVLDKARAAGASVILAGDDRQLASIERGGMFGALKAEHGAAELHNVRRVQDADQRRAYNHMHAGQFEAALEIFDQAGAIRWTDTQDEARAALVGKWAADTKADPEKRRFVFAYSNADVAVLNADLRAIRRERGELGEDHILATRDGPIAFAAGDRIQFTASAYSREDKAAGLVTSGIGTIRGIAGARVTVELDGKAGQKGRLVSFAVGADERAGQFNAIRHGYAGTIYKGQGRTLDQTYLYHSQHWRAASAYVALSRHREAASLFVAREVTRGREPWMMEQGGYEGLTEPQRRSADNSYQAWAEEHPHAAAKHGLADYVAYVQDKQSERGRSAYDMAQLARQISREDETRAASQFVTGEQPAPPVAAEGARPYLSGPGRYDALKAAAHRVIDPLADLMAGRSAAVRRPLPLGKYDALQIPPPSSHEPLDDLMPPDARAEVDRWAAERERERQKDKGRDL